jgi:hypothetical protein
MKEMKREAREWISRIRAAGMHAKGPSVVRTRGGAAPGRPGKGLEEIIAEVIRQPTDIRTEIVEALLHDSDDFAIGVLRMLAIDSADPDPNVRWSIAEGLTTFRHPGSIDLLQAIARADPDQTVRICAIEALGERAMAAYKDIKGSEQATPRAVARTRGAVRTRGGSPIRNASPDAAKILELLHRIRDEETSDEIRTVTDLTLRQLGE